MPLYDFILLVIKYGVAALFFGCIFFFVVVPLVRGLKQGMPEFPQATPVRWPRKPQLPEPEWTKPPPEPSPPEKAQGIIKLAKKDPKRTAQILRTWLRRDQEP